MFKNSFDCPKVAKEISYSRFNVTLFPMAIKTTHVVTVSLDWLHSQIEQEKVGVHIQHVLSSR